MKECGGCSQQDRAVRASREDSYANFEWHRPSDCGVKPMLKKNGFIMHACELDQVRLMKSAMLRYNPSERTCGREEVRPMEKLLENLILEHGCNIKIVTDVKRPTYFPIG